MPVVYECIQKDTFKKDEFILINNLALNPKVEFKNNISYVIYKEISNRIVNIKNLFQKMNKDFVLNALKYEEAFIKNIPYEKDFDKKSALNQIADLRNKLENNKIIMQLGKNTNYIVKSAGHAFDENFYRTRFYDFFNPGKDPKKAKDIAKPYVIGSMNIVSSAEFENYEEIPGFVEIEWL